MGSCRAAVRQVRSILPFWSLARYLVTSPFPLVASALPQWRPWPFSVLVLIFPRSPTLSLVCPQVPSAHSLTKVSLGLRGRMG